MPKWLHDKLKKQSKGKRDPDAYVYGTLAKVKKAGGWGKGVSHG